MISFLSLVKLAALADWADEKDDVGSFFFHAKGERKNADPAQFML